MNIALAYGTPPFIYQVRMSSTQKYYPEQMYDVMVNKRNKNSWILLDDTRFALETDDQLKLACEMACFYHNTICSTETES